MLKKSWEKKKCMPKSMKKKREMKRKKRNKGSPYFQIKGISIKMWEIHDTKEYQKYLELEIYKNSTPLHVLI